MIRAAVGLSQESNTARAALDAARQVLRQLDGAQPDWCIVFASDEHTKYAGSLQQALSSALGTPYVVGCSAAGVLGADREIDEGPGLGVLAVASDQLTATPFLFQDAGDRGLTAATRLGQRMLGSRDSGDLLLVWPDPFYVRPDLLLTGIDALLPGWSPQESSLSSSAPARLINTRGCHQGGDMTTVCVVYYSGTVPLSYSISSTLRLKTLPSKSVLLFVSLKFIS